MIVHRVFYLLTLKSNQFIMHQQPLIAYGATHAAHMIVEGDAPSKVINVNMRIPGHAAGNIYAVIQDEQNTYAKEFAYNPAQTNHAIDFAGVLPDGFLIPGRSFRIDFREQLHLDSLPVEFIASHRAALVHCVDDAAGVQPQTIGIAF